MSSAGSPWSPGGDRHRSRRLGSATDLPAPPTPSDAKSLLDARLASGDIDLSTYQSIRAAVNDSAAVNHEGTR
jgi:hypothetical protein